MTKKSFNAGGLSVLIALTLLAPVVAGAVIAVRASSQSPLESASRVEPLIGSIESAERYSEASVAIGVEFTDALSPSTNESGTLTSVGVAEGDTVNTGTVLMVVDDRTVLAYVSDAPLWRDIARGSKGSDVRVAQQLLKDLGYLTGTVDGNAGYVTELATRAFNKSHGYGVDNGVLSRASLVWVGQAPVTVAKMSVSLGDSLSPGTALFTTTASLAAITVSETPNVPRDGDVQLIVNDIVAAYVPGTGRVTDPDAVGSIAQSLGTATEGVGTVRLTTPLTVGTAPSSAVVTDEQGRVCIFADTTSPAIAIEPRGGSLGTVDLDAALVGQAVLINPREVRSDLSCGS